ncbi:MAG: hypothetical protein SF182_05290 [Deltaproteobacteria bacterium]|nr:hypothetical protein [Deltaproteobacteria bacterium]
MRPSAGFLLRFFAGAAALFALWSFGGVGDAYGRLVVAVANPLMRLTSGFSVSAVRPTERGLDVQLHRSPSSAPAGAVNDVLLPYQPRELFSGVVPFLALVGATTAIPWQRRLRAAGLGLAALFVFHFGLMLVGPYMTGLPQAQLGQAWMRRINSIIDVFYAFYGLVGYAALPFLLWFLLTQRGATVTPAPPGTPAAPRSPRRVSPAGSSGRNR